MGTKPIKKGGEETYQNACAVENVDRFSEALRGGARGGEKEWNVRLYRLPVAASQRSPCPALADPVTEL